MNEAYDSWYDSLSIIQNLVFKFSLQIIALGLHEWLWCGILFLTCLCWSSCLSLGCLPRAYGWFVLPSPRLEKLENVHSTTVQWIKQWEGEFTDKFVGDTLERISWFSNLSPNCFLVLKYDKNECERWRVSYCVKSDSDDIIRYMVNTLL